jgi:hypothetical protein
VYYYSTQLWKEKDAMVLRFADELVNSDTVREYIGWEDAVRATQSELK